MKIENTHILTISFVFFLINLIITGFTYTLIRNSPGIRGPRGIPGPRGLPAFGKKKNF